MRRRIIFLADDDRDDTEMFCEALEEISNYLQYVCAMNGEELLSQLHTADKNPDLIFLDLNMPLMNGWECLKNIKSNAHYSNIPVIIISTSSHVEEIEQAISLGALCYFVKPNSYEDLKETLNKIVSNLDNINDLIREITTDNNIFICV